MANLTAWQRVELARSPKRPTSLDYINNIFDEFIELHGDRYYGDDKSIVGGLGLLNGIPVTVIGQQKGRNVEENILRNFGMPNPEGYRKVQRLMKQAEKFNRPVIHFVDTPGAYPGIGAEERGQGEAIAQNLMTMSTLKTPIITCVIGEGGSGGALAQAIADKVYMLENAIYSILSPEGFATILWKDATRKKEAAEMMKVTAADLLKLDVIDQVVEEPEGGLEVEDEDVFNTLKENLHSDILRLSKLSKNKLTDLRYKRYREMGRYNDSN